MNNSERRQQFSGEAQRAKQGLAENVANRESYGGRVRFEGGGFPSPSEGNLSYLAGLNLEREPYLALSDEKKIKAVQAGLALEEERCRPIKSEAPGVITEQIRRAKEEPTFGDHLSRCRDNFIQFLRRNWKWAVPGVAAVGVACTIPVEVTIPPATEVPPTPAPTNIPGQPTPIEVVPSPTATPEVVPSPTAIPISKIWEYKVIKGIQAEAQLPVPGVIEVPEGQGMMLENGLYVAGPEQYLGVRLFKTNVELDINGMVVVSNTESAAFIPVEGMPGLKYIPGSEDGRCPVLEYRGGYLPAVYDERTAFVWISEEDGVGVSWFSDGGWHKVEFEKNAEGELVITSGEFFEDVLTTFEKACDRSQRALEDVILLPEELQDQAYVATDQDGDLVLIDKETNKKVPGWYDYEQKLTYIERDAIIPAYTEEYEGQGVKVTLITDKSLYDLVGGKGVDIEDGRGGDLSGFFSDLVAGIDSQMMVQIEGRPKIYPTKEEVDLSNIELVFRLGEDGSGFVRFGGNGAVGYDFVKTREGNLNIIISFPEEYFDDSESIDSMMEDGIAVYIGAIGFLLENKEHQVGGFDFSEDWYPWMRENFDKRIFDLSSPNGGIVTAKTPEIP